MNRIFMVVFSCLFCVAPSYAQHAGTLDYNTISKTYEFFDGANWYSVLATPSLSGCTQEGAMDFNNLLSVYQFCNGSKWVRIHGLVTLSICSNKAEMNYTGGSYFYCNGLLWVNMKGAQSFVSAFAD